jgi:hypothetical protein
MAQTTLLQLVHHHPGRIRIRADELRRDPARATQVRAALSALPAVRRVLHDAFTGSILLEYEPGSIDPELLLETALAAGEFDRIDDCVQPSHDPHDPVQSVVRMARGLNGVVADLTGSRADLRVLFPAGLAAAGFFSLLLRPLLPRWDNLLVWSMQIFLSLNPDTIRGHRGEPAR